MTQLLANGLITGGAYVLVAIGFSLIYGTSRFFHFAHGAVFTCGAYFAYFFSTVFRVPLPIAMAAAIAATTLMGIAVELFVYRQLRARQAGTMVMLIASLG